MGCADYHPAPCVLICPLEGCKKGRRQLNGPGLISQLYSHWQDKAHASNPAAKTLEVRCHGPLPPPCLLCCCLLPLLPASPPGCRCCAAADILGSKCML